MNVRNCLYCALTVGFLAFGLIIVTLQAPRIHATQVAASPPSLAITPVTVIDTVAGFGRPDTTVIVTGDRIVEVGESDAVKVDESARVVDGHGKFLLPGFWDMHVHVFNNGDQDGTNSSEYFFPLLVANGVVGVRDMGTDPDDIAQARVWNQDIDAGRLVAPRVTVTSRIVDGEPPTWSNSLVARTADEGRAAVRTLKASGAKLIKVYWNLSRESYYAIADEARQQGIPFGGHVPRVVDPGEASDAGQRTIEHMDGIYPACAKREDPGANERAVLTGVYDAERCEALAERLRRNGTWLIPTSVVFWDASKADLVGRRRYAPPLAGAPRRREPPPPLVVSAHRTMRAVDLVLAGTDVSIRRSALLPGFSLHDELALFVELGFTPSEALRAATVNPAKYAGMLDEFGTIEKNRRADLVLVDADPLADIFNASRISAVVLNGRLLDRLELDRLLAKGEAAAKTLRPVPLLSLIMRSRENGNSLAGTWDTDFPAGQPIVADLSITGTDVTGTIQAGGQTVQVFGSVREKDMTLEFASPDKERTIRLTGRINGDEIVFTRTVDVQPGGRPGGAGFFGSRGSGVTFTARRRD
jgi:hypothetical protein